MAHIQIFRTAPGAGASVGRSCCIDRSCPVDSSARLRTCGAKRERVVTFSFGCSRNGLSNRRRISEASLADAGEWDAFTAGYWKT